MDSDKMLSADTVAISDVVAGINLTEQQLLYVYWRGLGLTPRGAARRSGLVDKDTRFSDRSAYHFEQSPKVRKALAKVQEHVRVRYHIDQQTVITGLMESINTAKEQADAMSMIKGWSELARIAGIEPPKRTEIEIKTADTTNIQLVSDKELLKLLGKDRVLNDVVDGEFVELDRPDLADG